MVSGELAKTNLRKKRFFKKRVDLPRWAEGSEYGWIVIDAWGEVKPLKVIHGKDADIIIKRLNRQHGNGVKAERNGIPRGGKVCG